MKLSVIMPVFNEAATIEEAVRRVRTAELPEGIEGLQLIVVDDGSDDESATVLAGFDDEADITVLHHARNRGKGAAVRSALEHVTGDIVLIQDSDLEYDPRDYPSLLEPILEGRSKVVYGSRFLGGPHKAMLFWHSLGNRFLTLVTNVLYDSTMTDMESGYKVFSAEVLQGIRLRADRFDFEPEITAKVLKRGHRVYEVPITFTGREYEEGKKISWRDGIPALWTLIKYRFVD